MGISNPDIGDTVVFLTLANMRAGPPPPDTNNIVLLNRAAPYDGGGGPFIWLTNSPNALADNDCTVIIPANAPANAAYVRVYSGPVNVLWAGASTALADNSAAFNKADAAAIGGVWGVGGSPLTHDNQAVGIPAGGIFLVTANVTFHAAVRGMDFSTVDNGNYPIIQNNGPGIINYNGEISNLRLSGVGLQVVVNAKYVSFEATALQISLTGLFYLFCHLKSEVSVDVPVSINPATFYSCLLEGGPIIHQNSNDVVLDNCYLDNGSIIYDPGAANNLCIKDCTLNMNNVGVPAAGLFKLQSVILVDGLFCINVLENANPMLQATNYARAVNVSGITTQRLSFSVNHAATGGASPANVANAPVSGIIYQNTNPWPITIQVSVTYNPLAGAAATLTPALGPVNPPVALPAESEPAGLVVGRVRTYNLLVPSGYFYSFTAVNAVLGAGGITS